MNPGWDASGKLAKLWNAVGGRDGLAAKTGINGETLSGYNSGSRKLGMQNAEKIADALGVSLYDLGAPRPRDSDFALSLLGQIVVELERNPPQDPVLLRELLAEWRQLLMRLEAVADGQAVPLPPG